jgi:hypothetical protein
MLASASAASAIARPVPRRRRDPTSLKAPRLARLFLPTVEALEDRVVPTTFTKISPTSQGELPREVSSVGGIVLDLVGVNGQRVVSQVAADTLFTGYFDRGTPAEHRGNPGTIGVQTGITPEIVSALGGGLAEMAVRVTVEDGDTAVDDFDVGDNVLLLNGVAVGNFSDVATQETTSDGVTALSENPGGGFRNDTLDTGFFFSTDPAVLSAFYATLTAGQVTFQLKDADPFDNFFDFVVGLSGGLGSVGAAPRLQGGAPPAPAAPAEVAPVAILAAESAVPAAVPAPVPATPAPRPTTGPTPDANTIAFLIGGPVPAPLAAATPPRASPLAANGTSSPAALPLSLVLSRSASALSGGGAQPTPDQNPGPTLELAGLAREAAEAGRQLAEVVSGAMEPVEHLDVDVVSAVDQFFAQLSAMLPRGKSVVAAPAPDNPVAAPGPAPVVVSPGPSLVPGVTPSTSAASNSKGGAVWTAALVLAAVVYQHTWAASRVSVLNLARRRTRRG